MSETKIETGEDACDFSQIHVTDALLNMLLVASGVRSACGLNLHAHAYDHLLFDAMRRNGFDKQADFLISHLERVNDPTCSAVFLVRAPTQRPKLDNDLVQAYTSALSQDVRESVLPIASRRDDTCFQSPHVGQPFRPQFHYLLGRLLGYLTPYGQPRGTTTLTHLCTDKELLDRMQSSLTKQKTHASFGWSVRSVYKVERTMTLLDVWGYKTKDFCWQVFPILYASLVRQVETANRVLRDLFALSISDLFIEGWYYPSDKEEEHFNKTQMDQLFKEPRSCVDCLICLTKRSDAAS
jgi:hypothetical protein